MVMRNYKSNEEFFREVQSLATKFEIDGKAKCSQALLRGLSSVNGLTDGWALFMDEVTLLIKNHSKELSRDDLKRLKDFQERLKKVIFR